MAKLKGICRNEDCELCDQIQEAEKSNFKCEQCGRDLIPFGNKPTGSSPGHGRKVALAAVGVVVLLAIAGGLFALCGGGDTGQQEPAVVVADSDSIAVEPPVDIIPEADMDRAAEADTVNADAAEVDSVEPVPAPPAPKPAPTPSGTKNLGYAVFKGSWPNDVNGRMVFKSAHLIDSRDPKGRMAEAGDYVIGEFSDGHLVQGIWYGADNQVKGSIIIGK